MTGPSVGSTFAGCRIDAIAGRGGMGVVYRATQVVLNRPVALKVIAPDVALESMFQERFRHEARLAASIDHPHVVPVYEAGEIDGQLYLVMRWVEGVDLRALIDQGTPLQPERAARLTSQVARALGAAHELGLLHRDVKPANVLVADIHGDDHAYLTDFGIARLEHATTGLTQTGAVVGTIDYMPPERIEGASGDARSDVYSLGCMLYEMLAGRPPFVRDNQSARMFAHLSAEIPSATDARPEVPRSLSEVAMCAMAKQPDDRFRTAREMSDAALAAVAAPAPAPARAPRPAPAPRPPVPSATRVAPPPATRATTPDATAALQPKRGRLGVLAAAGAVVAAIVIALVVLTSGGDDAAESGGDQGAAPAEPSAAPAGKSISVRSNPDGLATTGDTIWATGATGALMSRIDVPSGKVVGSPIRVGEDPDSVAATPDVVWVTNNDTGSVSRIDASSGEVVAEIPVGAGPEGIALDGDGAAWVALVEEEGVQRIDPDSNSAGPLIETGSEPYDVLVDGETVWVANRGDGTVARFNRPDGPIQTVNVGGRPRGLVIEGSSVWVLDAYDRLVELDRASGRKLGETKLTGEPREITFGEGALWVTLHSTSELARVDPSTGSVRRRSVPQGPIGVVTEAGRVWVASHDASVVTPYAP